MKRFAVLLTVAAALVLALGGLNTARALDKSEADLKLHEATILIEKFLSGSDGETPRYLLQRCKAVVVIPNMVKAGFVVGARYGQGVISVRGKDGKWSAPCFIKTAGGNVGFQIGAESVDLFMVVMNQRGLEGFTKNETVRWGGNASVAAGPVGRSAEAGVTGASLKADVYSYSRTKGAFAGATVGVSGFEIETDANTAYYGKKLSANDILYHGKAPLKKQAMAFVSALQKYSQK